MRLGTTDTRGSATVLTLALAAVLLAAGVAVATAAGVLLAAARVRTAADLAALAGADALGAGRGGSGEPACRAAATVAAANATRLVDCSVAAGAVTVVVEARPYVAWPPVRARARAEPGAVGLNPGRPPPEG